MHEIILKSDFIILNLHQNIIRDNIYQIYRATGNSKSHMDFANLQ